MTRFSDLSYLVLIIVIIAVSVEIVVVLLGAVLLV